MTWIDNGAGQLGSTIKEMDGTAHNKMVAAFSHSTKMAGAAGAGLGNALGRDPNGKGKNGGAKPDRDAGITVGQREPEVDDPAGKKDEAKGKPGQDVAGDEGSLSSARRAAKATEGGAATARNDAAPAGHEADARDKEPQDSGGAVEPNESHTPKEKPTVQERLAQIKERPADQRKTTRAEDLAAFKASIASQKALGDET